MKTVPEMLREAAALYEERSKAYGDSYHQHGQVMRGLFPTGIHITSVRDQNRLGVLNMIVSKLTRYCNNFPNGGHDDSLADLAVYSQMLRELDKEDINLQNELEGLSVNNLNLEPGLFDRIVVKKS